MQLSRRVSASTGLLRRHSLSAYSLWLCGDHAAGWWRAWVSLLPLTATSARHPLVAAQSSYLNQLTRDRSVSSRDFEPKVCSNAPASTATSHNSQVVPE